MYYFKFKCVKNTVLLYIENFKLPKIAKEYFGRRVFILTDNDSKSNLYSKQMWFEMQRFGIECVHCSFPTPFPTQVGIVENASIFRRTGCTSILTIGNGSVADFGKGIRSHLSANDEKKTYQIPLIILANTFSSVYSTEAYGVLHDSEDFVVQSKSFPPQMIVFDSELLSQSEHCLPSFGALYLLAGLFDSFFGVFLLNPTLPEAESTNDILKQSELLNLPWSQWLSSKSFMELSSSDASSCAIFQHTDVLATSSQDEKPSLFCDLATAAVDIGALRSQVHKMGQEVSCTQFPALLEVATLGRLLNESNKSLQPFSWATIANFTRFLNGVVKDDWLQDSDADPVRVAAHRALRSIEQLTGMNQKELLNELQSAVKQMRITSNSKTRSYASLSRVDDDLDDFTAAGCVEKLALFEEMRCEVNNNQHNHSKAPNCSLRLQMLRSDLFLELMEAKLS